jgi:hypothetical protein
MQYKKYEYNGPVYEFDRIIAERWNATTVATSEAKARANLAYQYKKTHGKTANTRISCPGKLTIV